MRSKTEKKGSALGPGLAVTGFVALFIVLGAGIAYGMAGLLQWALWHCGVKQAAEWPTWAVAVLWFMIGALFTSNNSKS